MTLRGDQGAHPEGQFLEPTLAPAADPLAEVERRIEALAGRGKGQTMIHKVTALDILHRVRDAHPEGTWISAPCSCRAVTTETPPAACDRQHVRALTSEEMQAGLDWDEPPPTAPDTGQREALAEWLGDLPESRNVFDHTGEATTVLTVDVERLADLLLTRSRDTGDSETTVEWCAMSPQGTPWTLSEQRAREEVKTGDRWTLMRRERTSTPDRVTDWQEVPADE